MEERGWKLEDCEGFEMEGKEGRLCRRGGGKEGERRGKKFRMGGAR